MKPRWGMGSIGIMIVENMDELNVFHAKLHRNIFNTYLKYESQIDANKCIVIQEMIKGQEYGLDILNDLNGEFVTIIAKKKIALRAGETDIAEIVDNKDFWEVGKKLSESQIEMSDRKARPNGRAFSCLWFFLRLKSCFQYGKL